MDSSRLKPLLDAKQKKEEAFTRRLQERQQALAQSERKLAELRHYLEDYCRPQSITTTPAMLRSRREFIERLRSAVKLQEGVVRAAREACEQERQRWMSAHRDTEVFDRLTEASLRQEQRAEDRRQGREHDEIAAQRWIAGRPRGPSE